MGGAVDRTCEGVRDPHIRVLLNRITADHERELREWPAAQQIHHAYRGGLLEHTLKMAEIGRSLARAYDANEDLVLAGVLLHDIGKLQELQLRTRRRQLHARRQSRRPHRRSG